MSLRESSSLGPGLVARCTELAAVGVALVLLLGGMAEAFQQLRGVPSLVDMDQFLDGARHSTRLFDTGIREPLYCWFLRVALVFTNDDGDLAARYTTVFHTAMMAAALYWTARRLVGVLPAITALYMLCTSLSIHFYAILGLRDPLYSALLLLVAGAAFTSLEPKEPLARGAVLGALAGLTYLARNYGLVVCLGMMGLALLQQYIRWPQQRQTAFRRLGLALGPMVLLVALDLALRPKTMVADDVRFYRNIELLGNPDAIPTEQSVSALQYIFGEHTLAQVITRVAGNYVLFARMYLPSFCHGYGAWVAPWMALACVASLWGRKIELVGAVILSLAPIVFVLNLSPTPGAVGVDKRLVLQTVVFSWMLMAWTAWWVVGLVAHALANRSALAHRVEAWLQHGVLDGRRQDVEPPSTR